MVSILESARRGVEFANEQEDRRRTLARQAELQRRDDAAFNALAEEFGPAAADPAALGQLTGIRRAERADTRQQELEGRADSSQAALATTRLFKRAIDAGEDPAAAFDAIAPLLPNLGVAAEEMPQLREALIADPSLADEIARQLGDPDATPRDRYVSTSDGLYDTQLGKFVDPSGIAAENIAVRRETLASNEREAAIRAEQADRRLDIQGARVDPDTVREIEAAKSFGRGAGDVAAGLPVLEQRVNENIGRVDQILNADPDALASLFGVPSLSGLAKGGAGLFGELPGSEAADVAKNLRALASQLRSQAFETLKGGGHITEIESQFAAEALANLERAQSVKSAKAELNRLKFILESGLERAREQASAGGSGTDTAASRSVDGPDFSETSDDELLAILGGGG